MFKIEEIETKLIIGAIVLAIIGSLSFGLKHYYDKNAKAENKIAELTETNDELNRQIELFRQSKIIDNDIVAKQREKITELLTLNEQQKTKDTVAAQKVIIKYASLPQTPENLASRDDDLSIIRITGLWKTFCTTRPMNTECSQFKLGDMKNET